MRSDSRHAEQIVGDFSYFPEMHHIFSTRPNFNPPAVTTGVGPQGRKTVHFQALTDFQRAISPVIDPSLIGLTYTQHSLASSDIFNATENEPAVVPSYEPVTLADPVAASEKENGEVALTTPARVPKTFAFGFTKLDDAVRKAHDSIKPLSAKQSSRIEDAFTEMSRGVILLIYFTISDNFF